MAVRQFYRSPSLTRSGVARPDLLEACRAALPSLTGWQYHEPLYVAEGDARNFYRSTPSRESRQVVWMATLRFPQAPPTICLPARPPCPSRFVYTVASLCSALSRTTRLIPGKRYGGGVSRERVRDQSARRVQPLSYAGWCLDLMVTPFTGLDEKLEAKRQDDALPNGVCSVCP